MFQTKHKVLVDLVQDAVGCKRNSCRTYVSQVMRIFKDLHPGEPPPTDFRWLDKKSVVKWPQPISQISQNAYIGLPAREHHHFT